MEFRKKRGGKEWEKSRNRVRDARNTLRKNNVNYFQEFFLCLSASTFFGCLFSLFLYFHCFGPLIFLCGVEKIQIETQYLKAL